MSDSVIAVSGLTRRFGAKTALASVTLSIAPDALRAFFRAHPLRKTRSEALPQ